VRQQLLTKEIRDKLPPLYAQDSLGMEAIAYLKLFHAYGGGSWYATEFDGDDTFFGYVCGLTPGGDEFGYFSLKELESLDARVGGKIVPGLQAIERDMHFTPTRLCDIAEVVGDEGER